MLRLMRDYATSWMIKLLLGAIVIVFVFWGVGSYRSQRSSRVAFVNGEVITVDEYRKAYDNLIEQLRQRYGNRLNDDLEKMFQVEKQALETLINQKLILQEAQRLGFRVSDNELAVAIQKVDAFQNAGVFDGRIYRRVLSRYRMTPEEFEFAQRESILADKLSSFITGCAKVSDQEAMEWFKWTLASVNVDFVLFEPDRYENINPSEEELNAFFDQRKSSYKTESMLKTRFLHFEPKAFMSKVKVTEEEMRDYYDANPSEFKTEKTVEARHILIKIDPEASPDAVEKGLAKTLDVLTRAKEGEDFSKLAEQYSEGPSKAKGGYLGSFEKDMMVKPFADKAFSMSAGEVSEPVRTRFGWHLIKVEKVNEESSISFEEAKPNIQKKLADERAKNLAYDEAEAVYETSFEGDDLSIIAEKRDLTIQSTDFFTREGPHKGINNPDKFASAAFNLTVMEISEILDLGDGYYILQVIEKNPERIPEVGEVIEKVRADFIKQAQEEKARREADALLSALKTGKPMIGESEKYHLKPTTTGFFKRNESIPQIGFEPGFSGTAFKLTRENRLAETILKGKKGYYVIQLRERKAPATEGFEAEKEKIKTSLLQQKKMRTFNAYLSKLKEKSEISIEPDFAQ
ncbi:MAG: SurA N-terminal domain-containing protein [Deltaproteobacteria bacterium]|nr:SurA N-terminal domain-containing protein [Deltaproteobacteria bacterium]